ncbi:hypothetical protein BDW74DRAFT_181723 [Aspergillus multicolor]|uniref:uncharacterized protein n=1 Tax=Aspergillus multicolor TaxID=41759 RepID=UPI003CCDB64A
MQFSILLSLCICALFLVAGATETSGTSSSLRIHSIDLLPLETTTISTLFARSFIDILLAPFTGTATTDANPTISTINTSLSVLTVTTTTTSTGLSHKKDDTTGKWYKFAKEITAGGVTGLYGCTTLFIVSKQGVYVSHIYEQPVFVDKDKWNRVMPTKDDYFWKAAFDALINGDETGKGAIDPLKDLIGDAANPGPLHYLNMPKIFVAAPFKEGGIGPLRYKDRIKWLSDQLQGYLYPPESSSSGVTPEAPSVMGYKPTTRGVAENRESISGKAIMEATQIDHYQKQVIQGQSEAQAQIRAIGRWRLWVNGNQTVSYEFDSDQNRFRNP